MMRSLALTATGDFLLFLGVVFVLLGIANFVTDFLRVKGSGELLVGIALVALAVALLMRSREAIPKVPSKKKKEQRSEDYR
jgi:membrane protein implicated in regulation of membrane protease activity